MRLCPLAGVSVPCSEDRPLCPWCAQHDAAAKAAPTQPGDSASRASVSTPQRVCADCNRPFAPTSNHQARCRPCGAMRQKTKNAGYQQTFRQRKVIDRQREKSRKELSP